MALEKNDTKKIILQMVEDIKSHKRDKGELLEFYVTERINK